MYINYSVFYGLNFVPQNFVRVLTYSTSECYCIWRWGLYTDNLSENKIMTIIF